MSSSPARTFRDVYVLGKTLGTGNFSVVRQCRHKFSKNVYASKIIDLLHAEETGESLSYMVKCEVGMMRTLKHTNIVSFIDVFYTKQRIIIITELSQHGDLHDFIVNQDQVVDEGLSRSFALDISAAINFIHSQNVAHRDIKPENCLLFKSAETYTVKLCDFGLAEAVPIIGFKQICGSPSYVAPEILEGETYSLPVDIWSMGVLFYFLLCGYCPFEYTSLDKQFEMIMKVDIDFNAREWDNISNDANGLVRSMLVKNPKTRLTASKVMYHKWFHSTIPLRTSHHHRFKSAGIVIATTNMLSLKSHNIRRENAVLSRKLVEDALTKSITST